MSPGLAMTPESLFDARLRIVREANLEEGRMRILHDWFFAVTTEQEEGGRPDVWANPPTWKQPA